MQPVIGIGPLSLEARSLFVVLALWLGMETGARVARFRGLDGDHIYNAGLYALAAGVIVGRLAHVALYWPAYQADLKQMAALNPRALAMLPFIVAAVVALVLYVGRHRLPPLPLADAAAPGVLVGLALISVGNLLDGRAYGLSTNLPWAVSLWGAERHPTQLYEALLVGVVLLLLWRYRRAFRHDGDIVAWSVFGYGAVRLLADATRADSALLPGGFRTAQVIGFAAMLLALGYLWWRHRGDGRAAEPMTG